MDILLIIIIFLIVLTIGYILSKPFIDAEKHEDLSNRIEDYETQYQALLKEIRALELKVGEGAGTAEQQKLIAEKKRQAAELLHLINPSP